MRLCIPVEKKRAIFQAMRLVRSAKREIVTTMNVDEELKNPLPERYHRLLVRQTEEGITIIRYGFGARRVFYAIRKKYTQLTFLYVGSLRYYQRMLTVDRERGMFLIGDTIYYSNFAPLIQSLVNYVEMVYNRNL